MLEVGVRTTATLTLITLADSSSGEDSDVPLGPAVWEALAAGIDRRCPVVVELALARVDADVVRMLHRASHHVPLAVVVARGSTAETAVRRGRLATRVVVAYSRAEALAALTRA